MRIAFCDSSALVKLIVNEPESAVLAEHLRGYSKVVGSQLAIVEVVRAVGRRDPGQVARARHLMKSLDLIVPDEAVLERAATLEASSLRALDALQVASALRLAPLDPVFVAYDVRCASAASEMGLRTASPGQDLL